MSVKPSTDSHLSRAQLSEWALGERTSEAVRHVEACAVARHEASWREAAEDAAPLTQIDQETSRTVPAAMDPLSALVAGDGARAKPVRSAKVQ